MPSFFSNTAFPGGEQDDIQEVVVRAARDTRRHKLDLGIGMYRNNGRDTYLFSTVAVCTDRLIQNFEPRSYLSQRGDPEFLDLLCHLITARNSSQFASIQTVGGTGAVRLALELAKATNPNARVHVGTPTWSNHLNIPKHLGLETTNYPYLDAAKGTVSQQTLVPSSFSSGDIFIMHGPCHNPTGVDLSPTERSKIISTINEYGGLLLLDLAYYGLGKGLDSDLSLVRDLIEQADNVAIAAACSKAFGLYGDRTGALFIKSAHRLSDIEGFLTRTARQTTSSSPRFGAEIVKTLLGNNALSQAWIEELESKRIALYALRNALAERLTLWPNVQIEGHAGIFSLLPLNREQVLTLARDYAIHLPFSGRVNITGLNLETIPYFVDALEAVVAER